MNKSLKMVCVTLLVTAVVCEEFGRALKVEKKKQAKGDSNSGTGVSCTAFAAIKIIVIRGSCEGEAVADCKALATSQSTIRKAYAIWWKKDGSGECQVVRLQQAAKAVAEATATAFASSILKIKCTGKGFACGASLSHARAFAFSFAKAIAQAAVDSGGSAADAFCMADVEATFGAISEAAATAHSQACVKDTGVQADFQYAMISKTTKAIATAFVDAMAATCADKPGFAGAASKCKSKGTPTTEGVSAEATSATSGGKGGSGDEEWKGIYRKTAQPDACENEGECCDPEYVGLFCKPDPEYEWWTLVSEPGERSKYRSWSVPDRGICYCYTKRSFLPAV